MERKGVSQVLAIIVAASVLMMTALILIFLTTGSLTGFGETTQTSTCEGAIEVECAATGAATIDTPSACLTDDNQVRQDVNWGPGISSTEATCP